MKTQKVGGIFALQSIRCSKSAVLPSSSTDPPPAVQKGYVRKQCWHSQCQLGSDLHANVYQSVILLLSAYTVFLDRYQVLKSCRSQQYWHMEQVKRNFFSRFFQIYLTTIFHIKLLFYSDLFAFSFISFYSRILFQVKSTKFIRIL